MAFTTRPVIMGTHAVIATGHYLATDAGLRILHRGGNAFDAAVAAGFCLCVLEPQLNGIGGEVPMLLYSAERREVFAISGQGVAPKRATVDWFRNEGINLIPGDGLLPATVPGAFDAWLMVLLEFGTMTLQDVLSPAIELAEEGFPMYAHLRNALLSNADKFRTEWTTSARAFLPYGRVPEVGEVYRQPLWASTFKKVLQAEKEASCRGRDAGIEAARDVFYKGEIAEAIAEFCQSQEVRDATGRKHKGLLEYEDLAKYRGKVESPVMTSYRGYDVYKCGPWTQGPVFLQQLNLLEGFDLRQMGHNTTDYIHTVVECAKLAFADREAYYGDPDFDDVPLDVLLSKEYAQRRRALIDPQRASDDFQPGDAGKGPLTYDCSSAYPSDVESCGDTTHLDVIDAAGNMISCTPSGGWLMSSPVVGDLGFPLGTRGQMFFLSPDRPNALQPGKRPRTTLTPSLCMKERRPFMVFGTPGGDMQDQWSLQFFLNVVEFGMNLQEAADAPTFHSSHFPSSFYPRTMHPLRVAVEDRIPSSVCEELSRRGHNVSVGGSWSHGRVLGIQIRDGVILGAASPRMETGYAAGW